jgi:hypothetical protein
LNIGVEMSWDIFVMNLPLGIKSIDDIPKDYRALPLGPRSQIIAKIARLYPQCDFGDPSWGTLRLPECSIEFSLGEKEEVQHFAMHVRGGDGAPDIVSRILSELGMPALDPSAPGGLFQHDPARRAEGFNRWRGFRDHVIGRLG